MPRLSAALVAALFFSCATERPARAPASDPTNPAAVVPAAVVVPDPLAPVELVPEGEEQKKKDGDPSPPHHHHRDGATR